MCSDSLFLRNTIRLMRHGLGNACTLTWSMVEWDPKPQLNEPKRLIIICLRPCHTHIVIFHVAQLVVELGIRSWWAQSGLGHNRSLKSLRVSDHINHINHINHPVQSTGTEPSIVMTCEHHSCFSSSTRNGPTLWLDA